MRTWAVIQKDHLGIEYTRAFVLGDDFCAAAARARSCYPDANVRPVDTEEEEHKAIQGHISEVNRQSFERFHARAG